MKNLREVRVRTKRGWKEEARSHRISDNDNDNDFSIIIDVSEQYEYLSFFNSEQVCHDAPRQRALRAPYGQCFRF